MSFKNLLSVCPEESSESQRVGRNADQTWILLYLKLAFASVGEWIWESHYSVLNQVSLLQISFSRRRMASVAVEPQPVWFINSSFLIPFPPQCVLEVKLSLLLGCRVWWQGWPTYPWWAPHMTSSPRLTSIRRVSIPTWSLCVRWQRRAWRPSPRWPWRVLCQSSKS